MTHNPPNTSAASQALIAELDRRAELSRKAPTDPQLQVDFWGLASWLDAWYLINRGTVEDPRPYAIAADDGPMVCIYSGPDRAREAAVTAGLIGETESATVISLPLPQAIDWAAGLAKSEIVGITMDYPMNGIWCRLGNVPWLHQAREQKP